MLTLQRQLYMAESGVDLVLLWAVGELLSCVLFLMFFYITIHNVLQNPKTFTFAFNIDHQI